LAYGIKRFNEGKILLPFNLPLISAEILFRDTWFHDDTTECKILLRVKDLDEEGVGMHLTESAKVVQ